MKVKVVKNAYSGKVHVPRGEYWVSLNTDSGEMKLSAQGRDICIKAKMRRKKTHAKVTTLQYHSGGGRTWSLIITTPKYGEWIAFIEYTY